MTTKSERGHTPTPWFVAGSEGHPVQNDHWYEGRTIGSEVTGTRVADTSPLSSNAVADAALIVRAVNSHEALVEALSPFAALAAELFKQYETRPGEFREPYSDRADGEPVYAINGQPMTYGDLRKARDVFAALSKGETNV